MEKLTFHNKQFLGIIITFFISIIIAITSGLMLMDQKKHINTVMNELSLISYFDNRIKTSLNEMMVNLPTKGMQDFEKSNSIRYNASLIEQKFFELNNHLSVFSLEQKKLNDFGAIPEHISLIREAMRMSETNNTYLAPHFAHTVSVINNFDNTFVTEEFVNLHWKLVDLKFSATGIVSFVSVIISWIALMSMLFFLKQNGFLSVEYNKENYFKTYFKKLKELKSWSLNSAISLFFIVFIITSFYGLYQVVGFNNTLNTLVNKEVNYLSSISDLKNSINKLNKANTELAIFDENKIVEKTLNQVSNQSISLLSDLSKIDIVKDEQPLYNFVTGNKSSIEYFNTQFYKANSSKNYHDLLNLDTYSLQHLVLQKNYVFISQKYNSFLISAIALFILIIFMFLKTIHHLKEGGFSLEKDKKIEEPINLEKDNVKEVFKTVKM